MLSGVILTLGIIALIGGFGMWFIMNIAAGMAAGHTGSTKGAGWAALVGVLGLCAIIVSFQI